MTSTRNGIKYLPARWIDVAADAETVHGIAHEVMVGGHYARSGDVVDGVAVYEHGTQWREYWFDVLNIDLVLQLMGRPNGWGRIVVFTEPADAATRVTISLTDGLQHRRNVRTLTAALIDTLTQRGILIATSEPFSSMDLPKDSPGQPYPSRRKKR